MIKTTYRDPMPPLPPLPPRRSPLDRIVRIALPLLLGGLLAFAMDSAYVAVHHIQPTGDYWHDAWCAVKGFRWCE